MKMMIIIGGCLHTEAEFEPGLDNISFSRHFQLLQVTLLIKRGRGCNHGRKARCCFSIFVEFLPFTETFHLLLKKCDLTKLIFENGFNACSITFARSFQKTIVNGKQP